jgi:hypothetical protein
MGRHIVPLLAAKHCDWYIAVLDESATVQPAIESIADAMRLLRAFRIGSMPLPFAQQAKSLSHLRFSFIIRLGIAACR